MSGTVWGLYISLLHKIQYMLSLMSCTVWGLSISLPQDAVHDISYVWYCVGTVYLFSPQDSVYVISHVWYCVGTVYLSTTRCSTLYFLCLVLCGNCLSLYHKKQYMLSLMSGTVWGLSISLSQETVHAISYVWYCVGTVYLCTISRFLLSSVQGKGS